MNARTLRFVGIAGLVLAVLVALDGIYMLVINYKPDDAGSNTLHMTDATTVLIAAGLLLIISIVAFVLSRRAAPADTIGVTPAQTSGEAAIVNDEVETQDTARPEIQR